MKIAIPSYKRSQSKLLTIKNIPEKWHSKTTVFVREEEFSLYRQVVPSSIEVKILYNSTNIHTTRNEILNHYSSDILMLDDDLEFKELFYTKFLKCDHESIDRMFIEIKKLLDAGFVHVSVACPVVGLQSKGSTIFNSRYYGLLAYRVDVLKKLKVKFRTLCMSDFDVALQLTKQGYPSAIITHWLIDTKANQKGGCSEYRTSKVALKSALTLQKIHKPFVKVVPKGDWQNMENRFDVRIQWKRYFESSKVKHTPKGFDI